MKKTTMILVTAVGLLAMGLTACSSGNSADTPTLTITGKVVRVDYMASGSARYFFDSGAWVSLPKGSPGIDLGSIYKINYKENELNTITSITLVQK